MISRLEGWINFHQPEHLTHRRSEPSKKRPRNQVMSHIQLTEMGNTHQLDQIRKGDPVPGIDLQSCGAGLPGGGSGIAWSAMTARMPLMGRPQAVARASRRRCARKLTSWATLADRQATVTIPLRATRSTIVSAARGPATSGQQAAGSEPAVAAAAGESV